MSRINTVRITVQYFAALTDYTKIRSEAVEVPATLQVKDFLSHLVTIQSSLATKDAKELLETCACAVDLEYVDLDRDEDCFKDGAEVALIPPVSGG